MLFGDNFTFSKIIKQNNIRLTQWFQLMNYHWRSPPFSRKKNHHHLATGNLPLLASRYPSLLDNSPLQSSPTTSSSFALLFFAPLLLFTVDQSALCNTSQLPAILLTSSTDHTPHLSESDTETELLLARSDHHLAPSSTLPQMCVIVITVASSRLLVSSETSSTYSSTLPATSSLSGIPIERENSNSENVKIHFYSHFIKASRHQQTTTTKTRNCY